MIWTATKINDAGFCIRNFWYLHKRKPRYVPPHTGPQTKGIFLHHFKEKSLYKRNEKGIFVLKFKSPETFANTAVNRWNFIVSRGTIQGRPIKWRDKKEPWQIREEIKKTCKKLYEKYAEEEPPLFQEVLFDFSFDGRRYRGRIDEIRKNITLRDLKFSHIIPKEAKLIVFPPFTLYSLAYMNMCYNDREFAEICEVPEEELEKWMGNPNILSEKINLEYCLLNKDGIEIFPATRNNNHYYDFCNMLDGLEKQIRDKEWDYVKRGDNCAYCGCYEECIEDAKLKKSAISPEKGKQGELFEPPPKIKQEIEHKQLRLRFPRIKSS